MLRSTPAMSSRPTASALTSPYHVNPGFMTPVKRRFDGGEAPGPYSTARPRTERHEGGISMEGRISATQSEHHNRVAIRMSNPNSGVGIASAWERVVRPRPELSDLSFEAIRRFLADEAEYQLGLADEGRPPIALRALINPLIVEAMPRFIRNLGGEDDAQALPTMAEIATGSSRALPPEDKWW